MNLTNAMLGEKYFGIIYIYSFRFMKGIKVKEFEVVKVNKATIAVSFDKRTRKHPQLLPKEENECVGQNKEMLIKDYLQFIHSVKCKFPEYLKKDIESYCKRQLKEVTFKEGKQ
jgi:hypothetical protein